MQPGTYTGTGEAMKAVGQARLELNGVSTPDHSSPPPPSRAPSPAALFLTETVSFHGLSTLQ